MLYQNTVWVVQEELLWSASLIATDVEAAFGNK
jgi:hypothetical protein